MFAPTDCTDEVFRICSADWARLIEKEKRYPWLLSILRPPALPKNCLPRPPYGKVGAGVALVFWFRVSTPPLNLREKMIACLDFLMYFL